MLDITVKLRGLLQGFETGFPVLGAANVPTMAARCADRHGCQAQTRTCKIGCTVTDFSKTPLLDTIKTPEDLRKLKVEQVAHRHG